MTPVWVFPAYPLLLTAPMATSLISAAINSGQLDLLNGIAVALCAVTVQGTGFLIGFTICAAFIYRLMTQKLPRDSQRPGVVGHEYRICCATTIVLIVTVYIHWTEWLYSCRYW